MTNTLNNNNELGANFLQKINELINAQQDKADSTQQLILDNIGDNKILGTELKAVKTTIKQLECLKKLHICNFISIKDILKQSTLLVSEIIECNVNELLQDLDSTFDVFKTELVQKRELFNQFLVILNDSKFHENIIKESITIHLNKSSSPSFTPAKKLFDTFLKDNIATFCDLDNLFFNVATVKIITIDVLKRLHKTQTLNPISLHKFTDIMQINLCANFTKMAFKYENKQIISETLTENKA